MEKSTEEVIDPRTETPCTISYSQRSMIGHGSFGYVYKLNLSPSNSEVAIKSVLQDKRFKNRELEIMKLIHNDNIVNLLYYYYKTNAKDELYLNLILEYVPETLYSSIQYYFSKNKSMPLLEIKLYSYQLFKSLNYIHSLGICHRDIKPQNLLIDPIKCVLKLCDFGSAKILNPNEPNVSYICSRYYRSPELIFGARNYTTKIDVWSSGCVIAEMVLGQPLFPGQSGIDQLVEIIKLLGTPSKDEIKSMNPNYMDHKFPMIRSIPIYKIFPNVGDLMCSFFNKIFKYNPTERISAIEALADPYFDELREKDFQNLNVPNFRNFKLIDNDKKMPNLLTFTKRELSTDPKLYNKLIPDWKRLENGDKEMDFYTLDELTNPEIN